MQSFSSILFLLSFLTHNVVVVVATVAIADTGVRYPSEPDRWYSGHFIPGVNYMAHLQYLEHNLDLCPGVSTKKFTVKRPNDNFPVVLLAQRSGCVDWTRIQTAKQQTDPAGVVQFVIIYDAEDDEDENAIIPVNPEKEQQTASSIMEQIFNNIGNQERRLLTADTYDDNVNMGVLHVSASTGSDLLRTILQESNHTREMGGTRLLLNGETDSSMERQDFLRKALFYFGICFLVSGCCCSFILSVRLQILNDDDETTVAPPRPTRRRLTFDQVEEWVPEFMYRAPDEEGKTKDESTSDPVECTVCLDPFQGGEYMRRLPCEHEFHSYCIAKWLVERSSTCPLCKFDLLPENIEESDDEGQENALAAEEASIIEMMEVPEQPPNDEEEQDESTLARIWGRFWGGFQRTTHVGEEVGVDTTPLLSNNEENSSSTIELERLSDDDNNNNNTETV